MLPNMKTAQPALLTSPSALCFSVVFSIYEYNFKWNYLYALSPYITVLKTHKFFFVGSKLVKSRPCDNCLADLCTSKSSQNQPPLP